MSKSFIGVINRFIREKKLIQRGDRVLAAVSGGPDSMALLRFLELEKKHMGVSIRAAHFHHDLRGAESDQDREHVRSYCHRRGILFSSTIISVRSKKKKSPLSIEEICRNERYAYLVALARRTRCSQIATGHTMDDQAETVLMRILRGTGLRGLGAIPAERRVGSIRIIRPLLCVTKNRILSFLKSQNLHYRVDSSNGSPNYLRNRIRNHLIPHLESAYSPGVQKSLLDLADASSETYGYLHRKALLRYQKIRWRRSQTVGFSIDALRRTDRELRSEMYFLATQEVTGCRSLNRRHMDSIHHLVEGDKPMTHLLPRGLFVKRKSSRILFSKAPC